MNSVLEQAICKAILLNREMFCCYFCYLFRIHKAMNSYAGYYYIFLLRYNRSVFSHHIKQLSEHTAKTLIELLHRFRWCFN